MFADLVLSDEQAEQLLAEVVQLLRPQQESERGRLTELMPHGAAPAHPGLAAPGESWRGWELVLQMSSLPCQHCELGGMHVRGQPGLARVWELNMRAYACPALRPHPQSRAVRNQAGLTRGSAGSSLTAPSPTPTAGQDLEGSSSPATACSTPTRASRL